MRQRTSKYQSNTMKNVSKPAKTTHSFNRNTVNTIDKHVEEEGKIDLEFLKRQNVEFYRCNKCGKLKYRINQKQTTYETGTWSKKTDYAEKYSRYNQASQTLCKCGKVKTKCICNKKNRSFSTTTTKRSAYIEGQADPTPTIQVHLDANKIKKAVEEQKRIAEEEKRMKEKRLKEKKEGKEKQKNNQTEEIKYRNYSKEEKYSYNKIKETNIREEDLCNCALEDLMKRKKEEELRKKKIREREEEERKRREEEERRKREEEERRKREEEERRKREEEERRE